MNKLYRSKKNKIIAGICGGIGEYFKVDPTLIRLLWVLISVMGMG
ncbi:MAG TPA: PspC domain-containing protein, partial [Methanosarcina sp.]